MADLLQPTHPLAAWAAAFSELPSGVGLRAEPLVAAAQLRVAPGGPGADAAAQLLGGPLPSTGRWTASAVGGPDDGGRAVWLGPDEWLVTSTTLAPQVLEERLREGVAPFGGSAVDVSAQRLELALTGPAARDLLAGGSSLDLHPRVVGAGAAAQTTIAHTGVVLLSLADSGDDYVLVVRSSFARHLADWLIDASLELVAAAP